jgi:hypothetical protein
MISIHLTLIHIFIHKKLSLEMSIKNNKYVWAEVQIQLLFNVLIITGLK